MAKILLVEDDQSLREIYGIRLTAEGYEIVPAGDGEEALAAAVRERPDLIISDVMMPKISGFDMLDILRSTPETKDIKVIMMTALSSEDQRERGESLGADRFLVKSQVGIEDVVNAVHEVLDQNNTDQSTAQPENNIANFNPPTVQNNVFQIQQPATQQMPEQQPIQETSQQQTMQQISQQQPIQETSQQQTMQQISQQQPIQQASQQITMPTMPQPGVVNQSSFQGPISNIPPQNMTPVDSVQSNNNYSNDSYSINSVTDDSGMNIKDQMDQILGGMGSI